MQICTEQKPVSNNESIALQQRYGGLQKSASWQMRRRPIRRTARRVLCNRTLQSECRRLSLQCCCGLSLSAVYIGSVLLDPEHLISASRYKRFQRPLRMQVEYSKVQVNMPSLFRGPDPRCSHTRNGINHAFDLPRAEPALVETTLDSHSHARRTG